MKVLAYLSGSFHPKENVLLINQELIRRGHQVATLEVSNFTAAPDQVFDLLVTGLSPAILGDNDLENEVALGAMAKARGVPWLVFTDTYLSWVRPVEADQIGNALLVVSDKSEIEPALAKGFGRVVYLGPPALFLESALIRPAKIERKPPTEKIILVEGIKSAKVTDGLLKAVVRAMDSVYDWCLLFKPQQSGERPDTVDPARRAKILAGVSLLKPVERWESYFPAVDICLFTGYPTSLVRAAIMRAPAIYFAQQPGLRQWLQEIKLPPEYGPAQSGICLRATPRNLGRQIEKLFSPAGRAALRRQQAELYPAPPQGVKPAAAFVKLIEKTR